MSIVELSKTEINKEVDEAGNFSEIGNGPNTVPQTYSLGWSLDGFAFAMHRSGYIPAGKRDGYGQ